MVKKIFFELHLGKNIKINQFTFVHDYKLYCCNAQEFILQSAQLINTTIFTELHIKFSNAIQNKEVIFDKHAMSFINVDCKLCQGKARYGDRCAYEYITNRN